MLLMLLDVDEDALSKDLEMQDCFLSRLIGLMAVVFLVSVFTQEEGIVHEMDC